MFYFRKARGRGPFNSFIFQELEILHRPTPRINLLFGLYYIRLVLGSVLVKIKRIRAATLFEKPVLAIRVFVFGTLL